MPRARLQGAAKYLGIVGGDQDRPTRVLHGHTLALHTASLAACDNIKRNRHAGLPHRFSLNLSSFLEISRKSHG